MSLNKRLQSLKKSVLNRSKEFCQTTSLHGWKYIVSPRSSAIFRYSWLIICLVSFFIATYFVTLAWIKFNANQTKTVMETTQAVIYGFLFPAVTVCNLNKVSKQAAHRMADELTATNITQRESVANSLKLLYYLVSQDKVNLAKTDYKLLEEILERNAKTEEEVLNQITPTCEELIKKCVWKTENRPCGAIVRRIKSSMGYCCSFNYFALKNTTHDKREIVTDRYPWKTAMSGSQSGLELVISNNPGDYFASHAPTVGFRVLIHHPYKFPDLAVPSYIFEMDRNYLLGINAEITVASKNLKSIPISKRQCLFSSEQHLDIFEKYTRRGCLMECRMAITSKVCNCVPFDLYSQSGPYGAFKMCNLKDLACLHANKDIVFNITHLQGDKCNCPNSCEDLAYTVETSKGLLDSSFITNPSLMISGMNLKNHTVIRIFFNDLLGTKYRRDVSFPWHSLMGNYGGILSFFTGFSFTSVVEMFYTSLIRGYISAAIAKPTILVKQLPTRLARPKRSHY